MRAQLGDNSSNSRNKLSLGKSSECDDDVVDLSSIIMKHPLGKTYKSDSKENIFISLDKLPSGMRE